MQKYKIDLSFLSPKSCFVSWAFSWETQKRALHIIFIAPLGCHSKTFFWGDKKPLGKRREMALEKELNGFSWGMHKKPLEFSETKFYRSRIFPEPIFYFRIFSKSKIRNKTLDKSEVSIFIKTISTTFMSIYLIQNWSHLSYQLIWKSFTHLYYSTGWTTIGLWFSFRLLCTSFGYWRKGQGCSFKQRNF